ncbi:MAG: CRTAC1 family protein [Myxococcota bacterium]
MDLVVENVGRRSSKWGKQGDPTDVGEKSLNGYERNALFRGRGDGRFEDVGHLAGANRIEDGRGVAIADFDRDGLLDLVVQSLDRPAVLLMGRGDGGHWLALDLVGTGGNRDALGATATARVGARRFTRQRVVGTSFLSASSSTLHFGLGDADRIDALEIRWPDGSRQVLEDVPADQHLRVEQETGGATIAAGTEEP